MKSKLPRYLSYATAVILVLLPFHALFTTWAGASFGHIDVFRIWKELLLVPITAMALWLGWQQAKARKWLITSKLAWSIRGYILLNLLLGAIALARHQVNTTALIYALLINLRFLIIFAVGLLIGAYSGWLKKHWQKLLLCPAVIVVIFGLLQHYALPMDFLRHFGYGPDTIPAYHTIDQKADYIRIQSTLRGPNPLGAYLLLTMTAVAGLLWRAKPAQKRWLAGFFAASGVALFLTYSRSAWLGLALSLALLFYWSVSSLRLRKYACVAAIVTTIMLGSLTYALRGNDAIQNTVFHTDETSKSAESSNQARGQALTNGIKSVLREPLGRGPGTAGPASFRNNHLPRIAENYYIQIGQELGLIGLAIFVIINLKVGLVLWRNKQDLLPRILLASLIGITLVNMLSHAWTDDSISLIWWALAGVSLSPDILEANGKDKS